MKFLDFTLKIVFNGKYVAKITNPITKPVFDNEKVDIYWNKISRKKDHHARFFSVEHLNQL